MNAKFDSSARTESEKVLDSKTHVEVIMEILIGIVIGLLVIIAYRLDVLNHNLKKYTRVQNTRKESSGNKWLDMARERMGE